MELLGILLFNKSFTRVKVDANENIEEIIKYDEYLEEREEMRKEALENMRVERENNEKKLQEEGEEQDHQDFDRKNTTIRGELTQLTLAPFKSFLLPAQMTLYKACVVLRIASSIIMWNDSVAAFWIVTAALLSSLLVAWVPWAFLFRWAFKVFVWTVLGPWMKLVDIFYVHKRQNMTPEERKAMMEAVYQRRYNLVLGETYLRKLLKERSMKLQDMQKYMFGEVSSLQSSEEVRLIKRTLKFFFDFVFQYLIRVPIFKEQRYHSIPLSGGWAEPYDESNAPPVNIVQHVDGQYLSGDMVPKRENSRAEEERKKRAKAGNASPAADEASLLRPRVAGELTPLLEGDESDYASV
jgi:hypothetical protein